MQRTFTGNTAAQLAETYQGIARAPERDDDLGFFSGLWAIIPVALGGWALLVWAAIRLLG